MTEQLRAELPDQDKEKHFATLFELFNNRLVLFATGMLPAGEAAADLVQEAFVALWQRMDSFDDLAAIKVFLYLTVKNKCLNIYKHEKVIRRYNHTQPAAPEEKHIMLRLIEAEVAGEVQQALQQLPPGCRQVIHLSFFEGLRNQEVAARLHVSVNTVKTQKTRALRLMREILKSQPCHLLLFFGKIL
jgi:RNA polymerase sigma-70 factor (family 1)